MKDKSAFQQKIKLLTKLFDFGCNTEKKLQQLDMESILKIPGITIPDMALIIEFQKETKANKLFSYLGGGADEQQTSQYRCQPIRRYTHDRRCKVSGKKIQSDLGTL